MRDLTFMIVASLVSVSVAMAGPDLGGVSKRAQTLEGRRNYERLSYSLPSDRRTKRELDVCRALAAAITQTIVLSETREQRLAAAEESRKKVTVRGRRITLSYRRDLYQQQCYLAVGPRQKWKTINGYWAGGRVSSRSIARMLAALKGNGVRLKSVSLSVSDKRHLVDAKRLIARLRLTQIAVVGLDPSTPNHATVRLEHN